MSDSVKINQLKEKIKLLENELTHQNKLNQLLEDKITSYLDNTHSGSKQDARPRENIQRLIEEIDALKESTDNAIQVKNEFLTNMSHEMRTPLHAILSFAEMGLKKAPTADRVKLQSYFEHIHAGGNRLLRLLNDLLDLVKFDSSEYRMNFRNEALYNAVENIVERNESHLKESSINLTLQKPEFSTMVYMDIERIDQLLQNLINNAIKFSDKNSNITITFERTRNSLALPVIQLSVIDEGIGIPNDELEKIFDKFTQSSRTKTGAGGTGLGLSICKEILNYHLGEIWAEHNNPKGSIFRFTLPVATISN